MRKRLRLATLSGAAFLCLAWCPTEASAQKIEFNSCPGGNWSQMQGGCGWVFMDDPNPPVFRLPQNGDAAEIVGITGTFTLDVNSANLASLVIFAKPGTTGTFSQPGSTLTSGSETIGPWGTFSQTGGNNNVSGGFGLLARYNLQGPSASLSAGSEVIDQVQVSKNPLQFSAGFFNQVDGKNTVSGTLQLGTNPVSTNGRYDLNGGRLQAANEIVGAGGTGKFNQGGGENGVSGTLVLGNNVGGEGFYDLKGTGILTTNSEVIGLQGMGVFTQVGSATLNSALGTVTLGGSVNSSGQYTLQGMGNNVAASNEVVGDSGTGTFTQNAGSDNKISGTLTLGKALQGSGTYALNGGTLEANTEVVGGDGLSGTFKQSAGTNTVAGDLGIASNGSGLGTYNLSGTGILNTSSETLGNDPCVILSCAVSGTFNQSGGTNATNNLAINFGSFTLSGGKLQTGIIRNQGLFTYSGGSLTGNFTNGKGADFNISGAGTMVVNGALTNNGTVTVTAQQAQFSNVTLTSGVFKADPTAVEFQNLTVGAAGVIIGAAGDVFSITGNFQNLSTQNSQWDTSSSLLDFTGGGSHIFDLAGQNGAGFSNNFAWGSLVIDPGNTLDLGLGSGDALYAFILQGLLISGNMITNIDGTPGLFLYYDAADNPSLNGNYNLTGGGELIAANGPAPTPEPATLLLMASGLGSFLARRRWRRKKGSSSLH